jgi:hypothetical protein
VDTADHLVFDHAGHFVGLAALDPQAGLVVTDAPAPGGGDSHRWPYVIASPASSRLVQRSSASQSNGVPLLLGHDQHASAMNSWQEIDVRLAYHDRK